MNLFGFNTSRRNEQAPIDKIIGAIRALESLELDQRTGKLSCSTPAQALAIFETLKFPKEPDGNSIEQAYRTVRVLIWPTSVSHVGLLQLDTDSLMKKLRAVYYAVHDPALRQKLNDLAAQAPSPEIDLTTHRLPHIDRFSERLEAKRHTDSTPAPSGASLPTGDSAREPWASKLISRLFLSALWLLTHRHSLYV